MQRRLTQSEEETTHKTTNNQAVHKTTFSSMFLFVVIGGTFFDI